jgi:hypothetical protein
VARAYLDQLARSRGIGADRASAVKGALDRADRRDAAAREQLEALAAQLEGDAGAAAGRDAARLRSLASTLRGRAAGLR